MLKINKWNVFFVLAVCVTAIYYIIPNIYGKSEVTALPKFLSQKQVNLGLDLQGGSHLLLEVDTKSEDSERRRALERRSTFQSAYGRDESASTT